MDNCFLCSLPALLSTDGIYVQITTDICNESGLRPPVAPGSDVKSLGYKFQEFIFYLLCAELLLCSVMISHCAHWHCFKTIQRVAGRSSVSSCISISSSRTLFFFRCVPLNGMKHVSRAVSHVKSGRARPHFVEEGGTKHISLFFFFFLSGEVNWSRGNARKKVSP